jgi:hypothetical protein
MTDPRLPNGPLHVFQSSYTRGTVAPCHSILHAACWTAPRRFVDDIAIQDVFRDNYLVLT